MDYNTGKEAQVWQRIHAQRQEENAGRQENLPALILEQLQLASAYRQLAARVGGKDAAELMRLAREAGGQAACLKGIVTLINGTLPRTAAAPQQHSNRETILRRCYGAELRLLKAYENRTGDGEYGPVFDRLAARGREHCCVLLELIGKTEQPSP